MIRLCLDVNVWISHYLSLAKSPTRRTAARQLVDAAFARTCRLGGVQVIVSPGMLDTVQDVLRRLEVTEPFARAFRDQIELAAGRGRIGVPPIMTFGGTSSFPLRDDEDARVLATAVTGAADLLVTENLKDFIEGPNSGVSTEPRASPGKTLPDMFIIRHARLERRLTVAKTGLAARWLVDGVIPPLGVLERLYAR